MLNFYQSFGNRFADEGFRRGIDSLVREIICGCITDVEDYSFDYLFNVAQCISRIFLCLLMIYSQVRNNFQSIRVLFFLLLLPGKQQQHN